jgi:hypothetical protein
MDSMKNNFSYRGADGKRKLRAWVLAALAIFGVLLVLGGYSIYAAGMRQAQIQATPRPITDLPIFTPTAVLPTLAPTTAGAAANCPSDSSVWDFVDVWDNNNYKRIDPPCVYQSLNKLIAWLLAAQGAGWANQDAVNQLAFTDVPFDYSQDVGDFLPVQGKKPIAIEMSWFPIHKDFQDWYVANNAVVSDTFFLTGCYRTYDLVGNQKQYWSSQYGSSGYTVICEVAQDRLAGWDISQLAGNVYSKQITPGKRTLAYFAYNNDPQYRVWYYLGNGKTIDMSAADMSNTQAAMQQLLGSPVWDLVWLEKTYGMDPLPLPADWQKHTSQADQDAILAILNK